MAYAQTSAGKLYYEVIDHVSPWNQPGETVIFHHGIGAAPGIWSKWAPGLLDRYRMVLFDMRGYGRSPMMGEQFNWTLELLANDVFNVADAAGVQRFHLVGESIGGTVSLQCALQKPERLQSLTISNGAHVGTNIQRVNEWKSRLDEHGVKGWSDQFLRDRFYDDVLPAEERAWYSQAQELWRPDVALDALSVLVGTDLTSRMSEIHCPTLLMHGDSSPFIPVRVMAELHALLPDSRFQVFERARHGLPFSHAAQCVALLRRFLDELPHSGKFD